MDFLQQGVYTDAPPMGFLNTDDSQEPQKESLNKRAIRWIVMAGNVLPPDFTRQVKEMRMGGENLGDSCKTLMRATNGFLRRCQLTPMTLGYDFLNADSVGDDKSKVKIRSQFDKATYKTSEDYYLECMPGDEIESLLQSQQGADGLYDIGIREARALFDERATEPASKEFKQAMANGIKYQLLIFPEWNAYLSGEKQFFTTTIALTEYLHARRSELDYDETATAIIDVLLESNTVFERYATAQLTKMHDTIESGKQTGEIFNWNPRHTMWFDMLDLTREKFLQRRERQAAPPVPTITREEFTAQSAQLNELSKAVATVMPAIGQLAEIAVKQNTVETAPKCADFNSKGEPCQGKVTKDVDGKPYCSSHPKNADN